MNLPRRSTTSAPALPPGSAGGYYAGSGLATTSSRTPSRYADAGRKVFGGMARAGREAASTVKNTASSAAARARALATTDTLGGVMASSVSTGFAAALNGAVDGTEVGQKFEQLTGGWIKPSTAVAVLGAILRGFGLDKKLPRFFRTANTANLRALVPIKLYQFFNRVPGLISGRLNGTAAAGGAPALAGVAPSSTPAAATLAQMPQGNPAQRVVETVPGEATMA